MSGPSPHRQGPARLSRERLRHDLCTPINHLLGYTEILLEERLEPSLGERLRRVHRHGKLALEAIDGALRGPQQASASDDGVRKLLVEQAAAVLAELAAELDATDPSPSLQIRADLAKVRSAAENLARLADELLGGASPETARPVAESGPWRQPAIAGPELRVVSELASRVLVVDDDPFNRELMSRRLQGLGHAVSLAEDGPSALALLERERFDLILLDVVMPGMDGFEVLKRLKASPALDEIPVIVLSGLNQVSGAVKCIEMGAEDYLPKPPEEVLLRARIGASLEKKRLRDQQRSYLRRIEEEKQRADDLLKVILPEEIALELKQTNQVVPRRRENVAVMFADIVGFTPYCERMPADEMLRELQALTERFEDLALAHGIQKIKTIGDAFMAAAGLLHPVENPTLQAVRCGAAMIEASLTLPPRWSVRVGIHVGPVVAGVLGRRQYLFDLWGDTVNTAARVEAYGVPNCVTLSSAAWAQAAAHCVGASLGAVEVKGKGPMEIYRFERFQ